jgi:hypothetical protein
MLEIAKQQYELAKVHPTRAFLILFAGMMLLGPVLASALVYPLSPSGWLSATATIAGSSAFFAIGLAIHRRAPWLSIWDSYALLIQLLAAGFFIWGPFGYWLGYLHPDFTAAPNLWWSFGWGVCALLSSWGILRDRWWGYFGEVVVVSCVVIVMIYFPIKDTHPSPPKPESIPGQIMFREIMGWLAFTHIIWTLVSRGRTRLRASRGAGLEVIR